MSRGLQGGCLVVFVALLAFAPAANAAKLSVSDAEVTEGTGGANELEFTVNATKHDNKVTVHYATEDIHTTVNEDYTETSGKLAFPPGKKSKKVSVPVVTDDEQESDEQLKLVLSAPRRARIDDGEGVGTIVNDDFAGCYDDAAFVTDGPASGENLSGCFPESPDPVPSCAMNPGLHAFHSYTIGAFSTRTITVSSATDMGIALFAGPSNSAQEIDCADDFTGGNVETVEVANATMSSGVVHIEVFASAAGQEGGYTLGIVDPACKSKHRVC